MYCKNCGKKLPDDARFCDRCNMSVRKKSGKMDLIVELKEERLARRKAKAVEERLKKIKQIKRKRYSRAAVIAMILVGVGIITAAAAYISVILNSDDISVEAPAVTASPTAPPTPAPDAVVIGGENVPAAQ